jgi:hypothetical protein
MNNDAYAAINILFGFMNNPDIAGMVFDEIKNYKAGKKYIYYSKCQYGGQYSYKILVKTANYFNTVFKNSNAYLSDFDADHMSPDKIEISLYKKEFVLKGTYEGNAGNYTVIEFHVKI